jgi:hypothetical protein
MDVYVHLLPDDVGEAPECFDGVVSLDRADESDGGEAVRAARG